MVQLNNAYIKQIANMLKDGKSDKEIKGYFAVQYSKRLTKNEIYNCKTNNTKLSAKIDKKNTVKTTTKNKKRPPINRTYNRISNKIFWRMEILYTKSEKEKIVSAFPKNKHSYIIDKTAQYVSEALGWLNSDKLTPKNIKRAQTDKRFEVLYKSLKAVKYNLEFFLQNSAHPDTMELKKYFFKLTQIDYPNIKLPLQTVGDLISDLKLTIQKLYKHKTQAPYLIRPGRSNEPLYNAVRAMYSLWEECIGKRPTLTNKKKGRRLYSGPFIEYITNSFNYAIGYINKKRDASPIFLYGKKCKKKFKLEGSLSNIAREVIYCENPQK